MKWLCGRFVALLVLACLAPLCQAEDRGAAGDHGQQRPECAEPATDQGGTEIRNPGQGRGQDAKKDLVAALVGYAREPDPEVTLIVTQEYPSWAAFADAQAKTAADPEFSKWVAGLDKVRTIVSDSLYREL